MMETKLILRRLKVTVLLFSCVGCVYAQYPDPFLTDETRPKGEYFLYDPPVNSMTPEGEFYNDWWFYEWGKTQREYSYADWDADAELMSEEELGVYNEVIGIEIGDKVPEIMLLAKRAVSDVVKANKAAKNYFKRVRPFAFYGEPSFVPEKDEHLTGSWSYPSGHTARGWMFALVLTAIAPERTEALAVRANAFAMNRVICGHHWKSDIDAGRTLAMVIFAAVSSTKEFQEQLQKARAEYLKIAYPDGEASIRQLPNGPSKGDDNYYDLQGRRLESVPAHSVYIHNGRKILK